MRHASQSAARGRGHRPRAVRFWTIAASSPRVVRFWTPAEAIGPRAIRFETFPDMSRGDESGMRRGKLAVAVDVCRVSSDKLGLVASAARRGSESGM